MGPLLENKRLPNEGGDVYEAIKFSKKIDFRYNSESGGSMVLR
jgi:hypothetical protein